MPKQSDEAYSDEETRQRLSKILHGAFSAAPTPLAKIPTREGRKRMEKKKDRLPPEK